MSTENSRSDFATQIRDQLRVVREQKWLVLLCVLATTGGAYLYAHDQHKEYRATAKVLVQQNNLATELFNPGEFGTDPLRQAATDTQLANLPAVRLAAAKSLHLRRAPDNVQASGEGDANVIAMTVEDRNPKLTARYANAYASTFIKFRAAANKRRYATVLAVVKARLKTALHSHAPKAQRTRLTDQARQLTLVSQVQTGDAQVVQTAGIPGAPFKPRLVRTLIAGAIIGLLLGILLAFLRDRLDRHVKSEEQVRELFPGVPVIGTIPTPRRGAKAMARTLESFHNLEANVGLLSPNERLRSLLVTSASPGEGKSTVAANLALALGAHGRSPVVVEADLRRPALSERLKVETDSDTGVSRILVGEATLERSLRRVIAVPSRNGKGPAVAIGPVRAFAPEPAGAAERPPARDPARRGARAQRHGHRRRPADGRVQRHAAGGPARGRRHRRGAARPLAPRRDRALQVPAREHRHPAGGRRGAGRRHHVGGLLLLLIGRGRWASPRSHRLVRDSLTGSSPPLRGPWSAWRSRWAREYCSAPTRSSH